MKNFLSSCCVGGEKNASGFNLSFFGTIRFFELLKALLQSTPVRSESGHKIITTFLLNQGATTTAVNPNRGAELLLRVATSTWMFLPFFLLSGWMVIDHVVALFGYAEMMVQQYSTTVLWLLMVRTTGALAMLWTMNVLTEMWMARPFMEQVFSSTQKHNTNTSPLHKAVWYTLQGKLAILSSADNPIIVGAVDLIGEDAEGVTKLIDSSPRLRGLIHRTFCKDQTTGITYQEAISLADDITSDLLVDALRDAAATHNKMIFDDKVKALSDLDVTSKEYADVYNSIYMASFDAFVDVSQTISTALHLTGNIMLSEEYQKSADMMSDIKNRSTLEDEPECRSLFESTLRILYSVTPPQTAHVIS